MSARLLAPALSLLAIAAGAPAGAQSVRVTGATSVRYVELRPFVQDSVAQDSTSGTALLRQLPGGRVVRCVPGDAYCRDTRAGDVTSTVPVLQDLEVSAWGLGEGVRLHAQLRGRTAWGGGARAELWPRADDALDVLAAYAEIERERGRLRVGRQWAVSGLGIYGFDGVAAVVRPARTVWLEGYGGRSLVRGLDEPRTGGALAAIEPLAPSEAGRLLGVHARYRPTARLALSALYQVDLRADRRGVYSELGAADGVLRVGGGSVEAAVEADLATGALNEARLQVRSRPVRRAALYGELRRYRPYFELWTIWGAFSPVGFDEGRGGVTWADRAGRVIVRGEASYRRYGDAARDEGTDPLRDDGWGIGAGVGWSPARDWRVEASSRVETGFGAARRDAQAGVLRQLGGGSVALQALVFQRLYEFRLDEGTVAGLGAEGVLPLSRRTRLVASAAAYRHLNAGAGGGMDWSQRRGSVRLEWTLGPEPGARAPRPLPRPAPRAAAGGAP